MKKLENILLVLLAGFILGTAIVNTIERIHLQKMNELQEERILILQETVSFQDSVIQNWTWQPPEIIRDTVYTESYHYIPFQAVEDSSLIDTTISRLPAPGLEPPKIKPIQAERIPLFSFPEPVYTKLDTVKVIRIDENMKGVFRIMYVAMGTIITSIYASENIF